MSVLKSKRKPSQFEVFHHLNKVRKEVTDLLLRDFGYSKRKAAQRLEKKFSGRSYEELTDVEKEIYDHFRKQQEAFDTWFIEDERKAVLDCLRSIGEHVYTANSIYPTYYEELVERRVHQDLAIGQCYRLVQELQYAIETLPVDVNSFLRFGEDIQREIDLIKGWRKSDNKFKGAISASATNFSNVNNNGNALYDAYLRAKSGSDWKPQVQRYEMTYLLDLSKMQRELKEHTYEFQPSTNFVINERGKTRPITGEQIRDRIAKHSLCDEVLTPAIKDHLIYDNGASQKGKGIDFTRRRLEAHLHRFFRENQSNDGYILLMDFSKYYDNIRHDKLMELFEKYVDDDTALWFLEKIVDNEQVDVSYMSDEEYESAMDDVFNSLEHEKVDKSLLTGKKFLRKHLNIGDQVAQDAGIAYPIPIDNYIKIVKGVKFYGRYMDDSYVIHKDKEFLKGLLIEIVEIAHDLGITVNLRKTRICKLSEMWRFLQIQYSLTDTGRVIHKIHPKRLTGMRRKAKKLALILSEKDFDDWFRSWFNGHCHYMSKLQRSNMLDLCKKLKEEHYYGKTDFS